MKSEQLVCHQQNLTHDFDVSIEEDHTAYLKFHPVNAKSQTPIERSIQFVHIKMMF